MKYSNEQQHQGAGGRRSSRVTLNPYFIEDVAMTPSELARVRGDGH